MKYLLPIKIKIYPFNGENQLKYLQQDQLDGCKTKQTDNHAEF